MNDLRATSFQFVEELFRSQTGTVWKAKYRHRGAAGGSGGTARGRHESSKSLSLLAEAPYVVLKERRAAELGRSKSITRELELLQQLNHPNIIRCLGHFHDKARGGAAQNIEGVLYMVLEYAEGGDLYKEILRRKEQNDPYDEHEILNIFQQLCWGVQHLHEKSIIHRDIKALNVLLSSERNPIEEKSHHGVQRWRYKLGDLGVGRELGLETVMLQTFYGTPLYSSPELCANDPYNELTDIWSLGVVLYELCALRHPFTAQNLMGLAQVISTGDYAPIPRLYSNFLQDIIAAMLQKDWRKRPRINEILGWLESETIGPIGGGSSGHGDGTGGSGEIEEMMKNKGERTRRNGGRPSKSVAGQRRGERPPSSQSERRYYERSDSSHHKVPPIKAPPPPPPRERTMPSPTQRSPYNNHHQQQQQQQGPRRVPVVHRAPSTSLSSSEDDSAESFTDDDDGDDGSDGSDGNGGRFDSRDDGKYYSDDSLSSSSDDDAYPPYGRSKYAPLPSPSDQSLPPRHVISSSSSSSSTTSSTRRPSTAMSASEQRVETELRRKKLRLQMLHRRKAWNSNSGTTGNSGHGDDNELVLATEREVESLQLQLTGRSAQDDLQRIRRKWGTSNSSTKDDEKKKRGGGSVRGRGGGGQWDDGVSGKITGARTIISPKKLRQRQQNTEEERIRRIGDHLPRRRSSGSSNDKTHDRSVRRSDDEREERREDARRHRQPPQHHGHHGGRWSPNSSRPSTSSSIRDERLDTRRRERMERITGVVPRTDRRVHSSRLMPESEERDASGGGKRGGRRGDSVWHPRIDGREDGGREDGGRDGGFKARTSLRGGTDEMKEKKHRHHRRRKKGDRRSREKEHGRHTDANYRRRKGDHRRQGESLSHTREGLKMRRESAPQEIRGALTMDKNDTLGQSRRLKERKKVDSYDRRNNNNNRNMHSRREWHNEDEDLWMTDQIGDLSRARNQYEQRLVSHQNDRQRQRQEDATKKSARGGSHHYNVITGSWSDAGSMHTR